MGIMDRVKVEEIAEGRRLLYTFSEKNEKGELIQVELSKCKPDNKSDSSLPRLWAKNGFIDRVLESYWYVDTYVTEENGNCYRRYNPTVIKGTTKLDFDWVIEATEENLIKLLEEVERRAFGVEATIEVDFQGGESRTECEDCNYMLAKYINQNGEEDELYSEILVREFLGEEETEESDFNLNEWDEYSYPLLKESIIQQAKKKGVNVKRLKFAWDNFWKD